MVDSRNNKPMHCESCGFAFEFVASGHAPQVTCPVCGAATSVTYCHVSDCAETDVSKDGGFRQEMFHLGVIRSDVMKCRAKNCPRLNPNADARNETECHEKSGATACPARQPAPAMSDSLRPETKPKGERRAALLLSVAVQVFLLLATAAFLLKEFPTKPHTTEAPKLAVQPAAEKKTVSEPPPAPVSSPIKVIAPVAVATKPTTPAVPPTPKPVASAEVPTTEPPKPSEPKPAPPTLPPIVTPPASTAAKPTPTPPAPAVSAVASPPVTSARPTAPSTPGTLPPIVEKAPDPPMPKEAAVRKPEVVPPKKETPNVEPAPSREPKTVAAPTSTPPKSSVPPITKESRLIAADAMLQNAMASLAGNPEKSLEDTLHAINMYKELDRPMPSVSYWLLSQSYAALSWGKMFLINSPAVEEMTISPDSHWLLTQRRDESVWIWDVFRDQEHRSGFQLNTGAVRFARLRFSPDMRLIIGGQEDGTIRIWDLSQQERARQDPDETSLSLKETVPGLVELCLSPDGRWLAAFGAPAEHRISRNDRYLRQLSPEAENEMARLVRESFLHQPDAEYSPIIANGPTRLESGFASIPKNGPGRSHMGFPVSVPVSVPDGVQPLRQVTYLTAEASMLPPIVTASQTVKPAPSSPSSASGESTVWLWDLSRLQDGTLPTATILRGHTGRIHTIGFSDDSTLLAVGGEDAVTRIYDLRIGKPDVSPRNLRGHRLDVTALAFAPGGRWIATGSRDNTIRLWSLDGPASSGTVSESVVLDGHLGWISSLVVDPKGSRMYSGSYDKTIRVWDVHPTLIGSAVRRPPMVLQNDQGVIRELVLTPDAGKLVSRGDDGSLRIRNLDGVIDNQHSVMFRNRMLPITNVAVTPDNRWLIFGYVNQRNPDKSGVRLWPLGFEHLMEVVGE